MSLLGGSLFTEMVTVRHPGGLTGEYDKYGQPIESPPFTETVSAWYEPRGSSEDVAAKDQQINGYWLYMNRAYDLSSEDQVMIEGNWYEVDGEPGRMPNGFLLGGYSSVALRRVTG